MLGALGVYRAAFATMEQTLPLTKKKVTPPVVAIGGEMGLGKRVGEAVSLIVANVKSVLLQGCGHFIPEECPEAILEELGRLRKAQGGERR